MSVVTDSYLSLDGKAKLRCRVTPAEKTPQRGSVLLLQGRGDCLEQYGEITQELSARGFSVYSFDWRGQGLSTRPFEDRLKCHVQCFETYLEDLLQFIARVWRPQGPNCYILSHSMGGHLALRYLAANGLEVSGALLCAPMIGIQTRRWPKTLAPMIIEGMIGLGLADIGIPGTRSYRPSDRQFEGNPLTGDERRFYTLPNAVRDNPDLEVGGPTFGWVDAAFRSMAVLMAQGGVESIKTPVIILVGDADVVIDLEAARAVARRLCNSKFRLLKGARHEIMLEIDSVREEFWRFFDEMVKGGDPDS